LGRCIQPSRFIGPGIYGNPVNGFRLGQKALSRRIAHMIDQQAIFVDINTRRRTERDMVEIGQFELAIDRCPDVFTSKKFEEPSEIMAKPLDDLLVARVPVVLSRFLPIEEKTIVLNLD
jgi:hypothetical protein